MKDQVKRDGAQIFAAAFTESLAASLAEAVGAPWPLELLNSESVPTNNETPIQFRLTVEGAVCGDCFVELYQPQVRDIVSKILNEPVQEVADIHIELLSKIISSCTAKMVEPLFNKFGPLSFKVDRVAGLAFGGMFVIPIVAREAGPDLLVLLYFGGQLLDAMAGGSAADQAVDVDASAIAPRNLKLVMDVELNVSLRFGQRQLPLRDVLELGSGSVVELDRMVDEPVELFLDGKLIARGEAVVVDGNYGLRVTEIPQPLASHFLN